MVRSPSRTDGPVPVAGFLPHIWGVTPARPTWSSTPHSPAEVLAARSCASVPLLTFSRSAAMWTAGEAGLTPKPHRDRTTTSRLTWTVLPATGIGLPAGAPADATTDPGGRHLAN